MYTKIPILFDRTISIQIYILNIFEKKFDGFQKFLLVIVYELLLFTMIEKACKTVSSQKGPFIATRLLNTVWSRRRSLAALVLLCTVKKAKRG